MENITPPTDLLTLESLPFDAQKKVALNLPYETVISFCKVSKKLKRICDDIYFWKDYLRIQVPVNINVPSGASIGWYKDKIKQYPKVEVITDLLDQGKATGNYIQELNNNWNVFERVENLEKLVCQNSQLTSMPSMPNLQDLYCRNNQLTSISLMPSLQELNCGNNQLTSILSMPSLRYLHCDNNQLTSILSMPNLQGLNCGNNQLTSIPSMPSLRVLYCENNQLTSMPSMPSLRVLYCRNNPLPGFTLDYWRDIWNKES
jgi:Leucine-rich repeat (LRR) protein